jgi:hypothetical protein
LYFNNLDVPYNEGQPVFELHRGDFIQKEEMVRIADGMFKIPLFDEAKSYIFKDASNIKISNEHLRRSADQPEIVVINDMPQGLVRTLLNENEIYKIYHQPEAIWRKPLGIIEIFPSALHEQFKTYGKVNYSIP